MLVYRVRWQIELVFKLWKSQVQLDVPIEPTDELSRPKAFAILQRFDLKLPSTLARLRDAGA